MSRRSCPERKRKLSDAAQASSPRVRPRERDGAAGPPPRHPEADEDVKTVHQRDHDPSGRWDHCVAQDYAKVQYGHTYIERQYVDPEQMTRERLEESNSDYFLEALKFDEMDTRYESIDLTYANTCRWLFQKQEYIRWRDPAYRDAHHGFLWIKGKAGSGKSTMMKCAFGHAEAIHESDSIISYFFNARGHTTLERSVEGMYRSLLFQLLEKLPKLRSVFPTPNVKQKSWNVSVLRNYFSRAVASLSQDHDVTLYIDALDECDEEDMREAIEHFEELGALATTQCVKFHICFASRYYPSITIQRCLEVRLEAQDEHKNDIRAYVNAKLTIRDPELRSQLAHQVQARCSGVFFWVMLVVRILKRKSDTGASTSDMLRTLDEVPDKLRDLIANIFDEADGALMATMQWILFAERPLGLEELYFAIRISVGQLGSGRWDPAEIDRKGMELYILNSSRGLLEMKGDSCAAQLIHESVREYLLDGGLAARVTCLDGDVKPHSEAQLFRWCQRYIWLGMDSQSGSPQLAHVKSWHEVGKRYPLLEYAVQNVFHHMHIAYCAGILHLRDLYDFPVELWVSLRSMQHTRKSISAVRCDSAAFLYWLIEQDCRTLVEDFLQSHMTLPLIDENSKSHKSTTARSFEFLRTRLDVNAHLKEKYPALLSLATKRRQFGVVKALLDYGAHVNSHGDDALLIAIFTSNIEIVQLLLSRGANPDAQRTDQCYSLALAFVVHSADEVTVKALLRYGANANGASDHSVDNPLLAAPGYTGTCDHPHEQGDDGGDDGIVSDEIISWNEDDTGTVSDDAPYDDTDWRISILRVLLDHGADMSRKFVGNLTPLTYAAGHCDVKLVQVLLNHRSYVANNSSMLLMCATEWLNLEVVRLLLGRHSPTLATPVFLRSALHTAMTTWNSCRRSKYGRDGIDVKAARSLIVRMLLDAGADANAVGENGSVALIEASFDGYTDIVKLLIDAGADANAVDENGNVALIEASIDGHTDIVKLLIDAGADVHAGGCTPLLAASCFGHVAIARLLIDAGANINAADEDGWTPLSIASDKGQFDTLKLLVERGADLHHRDIDDETALDIACLNDHLEIVRFLEDSMEASTDPATVCPTETPQPQSSARPWLL